MERLYHNYEGNKSPLTSFFPCSKIGLQIIISEVIMNFDRMLAYTDALSKNNNRVWFHDNHADYDDAKEDSLRFWMS